MVKSKRENTFRCLKWTVSKHIEFYSSFTMCQPVFTIFRKTYFCYDVLKPGRANNVDIFSFMKTSVTSSGVEKHVQRYEYLLKTQNLDQRPKYV